MQNPKKVKFPKAKTKRNTKFGSYRIVNDRPNFTTTTQLDNILAKLSIQNILTCLDIV